MKRFLSSVSFLELFSTEVSPAQVNAIAHGPLNYQPCLRIYTSKTFGSTCSITRCVGLFVKFFTRLNTSMEVL